MTFRGMKQGLAVTAVGAMLVTGVPFLATQANADPLVPTKGTTVTLLTQFTTKASTKNDGQDTKVHLVAAAAAGVAQVQFSYRLATADPADPSAVQSIGTATRDAFGGFSYFWTPPALAGGIVVIATATDAVTGASGQSTSPVLTVGSTAESVDLQQQGTLALFDQPYGVAGAAGDVSDLAQKSDLTVASGTTSASVGTLVSLRRRGEPGKGISPTDVEVVAGPTASLGKFTGIVNLGSYNWGRATVHQVGIGANIKSNSDDAETYLIEKQSIAKVTAAADKALLDVGQTTEVTVTVTDAKGRPVPGAEVFRQGAVNRLVGYTNALGKIIDTGPEGAGVGAGSHTYYANSTAVDGFEPAVDFRSAPVVIASTAGSVTAVARTRAYDVDEAGRGMVTVTVRDRNGQALAGKTVHYAWTFTPFTAFTGTPGSTDDATGTTTSGGTLGLPVPSGMGSGTYLLNAYLDITGGSGQQAGDLAAEPVAVKAGEAEITWKAGSSVRAAAGTRRTVTGRLALQDGTLLANRALSVGYRRSTRGNAALASKVTTSGTGSFSVTVADPDPGRRGGEPAEAGVLTARAVALKGPGDVAARDATGALKVSFVAVRRAVRAALRVSNNRRGDDVAVVDAPRVARGATVKLYKIRRNGSHRLIAVRTANRRGDARFTVTDPSKRGVTTYQARVLSTPWIKADWTPRRRAR